MKRIVNYIIMNIALLTTSLFSVEYSLTGLGSLYGSFMPTDINESGEIVGYAKIYDSVHNGSVDHACLWKNGCLYDLGDLPNGSWCDGSYAYSINDSGAIVGRGTTQYSITYGDGFTKFTRISNAAQMAFVYSQNSMVGIDDYASGKKQTSAFAINNSGKVVGMIYDNAYDEYQGDYNVFLTDYNSTVDDGQFLPITKGVPNDLDDNGNVIGYQTGLFSTNSRTPFLWDSQRQTLIHLDVLNIENGEAVAINNNGIICGAVGQSLIVNDNYKYTEKAVIWDKDHNLVLLDEINPDFNIYKRALDINNNNVVVGYEMTRGVGGNSVAVMWENGNVLNLNDLLGSSGENWNLISATSINDKGVIVGCGYNPDGKIEGYMLTPVPEPMSAILLGLGVLVVMHRRESYLIANPN